jgi:hypothetical protein
MDAITGLLADGTTLWTAISVLAITVIGFVIGRRFVKKV